VKTKPLQILSLVILVLLAGYFGWQIPLKKKYDHLRDQLLDPSLSFRVQDFEQDDLTFLETVKKDWDVVAQECPDVVFAEISEAVGFEESAQGVVDFHTYKLAPFSFFNHRQNVNEMLIATTMAMALPNSMDHLLYLGEGVCFIKYSEEVIEVFEDTQDGLSRTLYRFVKSDEE